MRFPGHTKQDGNGTSLVVQWLGHHASNAGGTDLIPGQGTRIPHATVGLSQKVKNIKKRQ